jgi:predicted dehydrogenase
MKKYILVIGAGNLGRRHIQSLKLSTHELEVYVVDTSKEALSQVKEAVEQVQMTTRVRYFTQLEDVPNKIDVAIVATTANSRLLILRALIDKGVNNIILEKIAFNSLQDIAEATELVSSAVETKVWVNCPRRLYPIYQLLKKELKGEVFKRFHVKGSNYGMGCNGIHFIDLLAFLIGESNYQLSSKKITRVEESKRDGYIELFGILDGSFASGCELVLECRKDDGNPDFRLCFEMEKGMLTINELAGEAVLEMRGASKTIEFNMPYQSELTGPLVDQILLNGECGLTVFEESIKLHKVFIATTYLAYAEKFGKNKKSFIPLT